MTREELEQLHTDVLSLEDELDRQTNPQSLEKDRDLIIEIRAGTGGL